MPRGSSRKAGRVVKRTLADGTQKSYHYPPYRQRAPKAKGDTVGDIINAWQRSPAWRGLAEGTQANYVRALRYLAPTERLLPDALRLRDLVAIRDRVATLRGPGAATAFVRTVSALFGWAVENGWMKQSPSSRLRRIKGGHLPAWSEADAKLAMAHLLEHLRRAVVLALYTGQRRGDLVHLTWSAYDGRVLRLVQEKTKTALVIPCHPVLKAELDAWHATRTSTTILTNGKGLQWTGTNLSHQLGAALAAIPGVPPHRNIHGLRKLAAASLANVGCTIHEIAAVTGHKSMAMLELYTASADQERLATAAILRLTQAERKDAEGVERHDQVLFHFPCPP
jgi:integrase